MLIYAGCPSKHELCNAYASCHSKLELSSAAYYPYEFHTKRMPFSGYGICVFSSLFPLFAVIDILRMMILHPDGASKLLKLINNGNGTSNFFP